MKHIVKGLPPPSLEDWKQAQLSAGIPPVWGDFRNPEKGDCRTQLLAEQGAICCYCNGAISADMMHIEHYQPQATHGALALEWTNLLGCCAPKNIKGRKVRTQSHCGEFRGTSPLGVSPLEPTCEAQFRYSSQGGIGPEPTNNAKARTTISNLNLESESLRARRQQVIAEAYEAIEDLTIDEWLQVYVDRSDNEYHEFAAMLRWFFETSWQAEMLALSVP